MPLRFLIPLTLVLAAFAQDQPPRPTGAGINFYDTDQEIAMGAQLAASVRRDTKTLENAAVQEYVNRLGAQLSAQTDGHTFTYSFSVLADDGGGPTHEPFALPGGPIFIPKALILEARSESEFAGMLAHAVAHVACRHYTRQATRANLMQIGAISASMALDSWTGYAIRQGAGLAIPMGFLAFQRTFEREADFQAVQILSKAGIDPAGLATYIRRTQPPNDTATNPKVFSPLPPVEERVSAIEAAIAALPARTYTSNGEFAAIQSKVR